MHTNTDGTEQNMLSVLREQGGERVEEREAAFEEQEGSWRQWTHRKGTIASLGNKAVVGAQGPLRVPHILGLPENGGRALSTFRVLDQHGFWEVEGGRYRKVKSSPPGHVAAPPLVPCAPVVQAFFLSWSEQSAFPARGLCTCCSLGLGDHFTPSSPTTPTYTCTGMPSLNTTVSLSTLSVVLLWPHRNCDLNTYCVIFKSFAHWSHVLLLTLRPRLALFNCCSPYIVTGTWQVPTKYL